MTDEKKRRPAPGRPATTPDDIRRWFMESPHWMDGPDGPVVWVDSNGKAIPKGKQKSYLGRMISARRVALWLDGRLDDLTGVIPRLAPDGELDIDEWETKLLGFDDEGNPIETEPRPVHRPEWTVTAPACDCHLNFTATGRWCGEVHGFDRWPTDPELAKEPSITDACMNPRHQAIVCYMPPRKVQAPTPATCLRPPLWMLHARIELGMDDGPPLAERPEVIEFIREYGLNPEFGLDWIKARTPASGLRYYWWWNQLLAKTPRLLRTLLSLGVPDHRALNMLLLDIPPETIDMFELQPNPTGRPLTVGGVFRGRFGLHYSRYTVDARMELDPLPPPEQALIWRRLRELSGIGGA